MPPAGSNSGSSLVISTGMIKAYVLGKSGAVTLGVCIVMVTVIGCAVETDQVFFRLSVHEVYLDGSQSVKKPL